MAEKSGHKFIERGAHKGKGIAVFTSGGDSQVFIIIWIRNVKLYLCLSKLL